MKNFVILMMLMLGVTVGQVNADMTYAPFLFDGKDQSGSPIGNGTYSMILDLDGDGWNSNSYLTQSSGALNGSSWLWDTDDFLMDRGQISDGLATPFKKITSSEIPAGYNANQDNYYLLWFNKPYDLNDIGPGHDIFYGVEDLGKVGTDPGDYTPIAVGGNAVLKTLGTQVVPEPISTVLAVIGGGAMMLRRRFNRVNA